MQASEPSSPAQGPFPETHWSLIRRCQDLEITRDHLEGLFRKYWGPVYYHISRDWALDSEEASDMTQGFFLAFLERDFLASVDADRGRFRTFLKVAIRHFLTNWKRDARAKKRHPEGGVLSLEALRGDNSVFEIPDSTCDDPARQFDLDWRGALLDAALSALRNQAKEEDKETLVDLMVTYDLERSSEEKKTYGDLAEQFGLTVYQVRNGLRWARQGYLFHLRRELREQVASEEDFRREARELLGMRV